MSASIEARREARRRKILENSEKRLAKILSKDDKIEEKEESPTVFESQFNSRSNNFSAPANNSSEIDDYHNDNFTTFSQVKKNFFPPELMTDDEKSKIDVLKYPRKSSKLFSLFFVFLAIIIRFIIETDYGLLYNNSIFLPFLTLSAVKVSYTYPRMESPKGFVYTALILNGLQPSIASIILKLYKLSHRIFLDFCVYFFAFVCVHLTTGYFWLR